MSPLSHSISNTSLFYWFCAYSHLLYPIPSLSFTLGQSSRFGLIARAPSIIQYGQSLGTSWTSVGDSSQTSCSNTSLFYSLFFYLHILYPSLSLLSTFRQSLHFGLSARAPLIIQYGQSIYHSWTWLRDSSPTSRSYPHHFISKHSIYTYSIHLLHFYPLPTSIPALGLLTPSTFRILP